MHARYYHPYLARFISADTIVPGVDSRALNRYMYARGNPLLYTDPSGHSPKKPTSLERVSRKIPRYAVPVNTPAPPIPPSYYLSTPTPTPPEPTVTPAPTQNPGSFISPVAGGWEQSGYGFTWDPVTCPEGHVGIDIVSVNDPGSDFRPKDDKVPGREVYAMADGTVRYRSHPDADGWENSSGIQGWTTEIQHGEERWQYTHMYPMLDDNGYYVMRWSGEGWNKTYTDEVQQGDMIGYYADIGFSYGRHLHLTRKVKDPVTGEYTKNYADPTLILP
jgi:hypothetical protein